MNRLPRVETISAVLLACLAAVNVLTAVSAQVQWQASQDDPRFPLPTTAAPLSGNALPSYRDSTIAPDALTQAYLAILPQYGWAIDTKSSWGWNGKPKQPGDVYVIGICQNHSWSAVSIGPPSDGSDGSEFDLAIDADNC